MTELAVIAGAVGGYVLYRKWRAAREYNRRLSIKRAEAVCNYLIRKGINKERLRPAGYGSDHPLYSNSNH